MCQILNLRLVTAQSIYNVLSACHISIAVHFYYAMHFGAKSRTAVLRSLVVRLSIRLSVCQFLTRHISLKVPFTTIVTINYYRTSAHTAVCYAERCISYDRFCPSVYHSPASCQNNSSYDQAVFTAG